MFCPNCGTKNIENALFCCNCGIKLEDFTQTPAPAVEPENTPEVEAADNTAEAAATNEPSAESETPMEPEVTSVPEVTVEPEETDTTEISAEPEDTTILFTTARRQVPSTRHRSKHRMHKYQIQILHRQIQHLTRCRISHRCSQMRTPLQTVTQLPLQTVTQLLYMHHSVRLANQSIHL